MRQLANITIEIKGCVIAISLLLKGYKLLRYEKYCRYIPLIFKYFYQNAHGFVNILKYYNMIILKFDHLLNILLS